MDRIEGEVTVAELAAVLHVTPMTVHRRIAALDMDATGHVRRDDGPRRTVYISRDGASILSDSIGVREERPAPDVADAADMAELREAQMAAIAAEVDRLRAEVAERSARVASLEAQADGLRVEVSSAMSELRSALARAAEADALELEVARLRTDLEAARADATALRVELARPLGLRERLLGRRSLPPAGLA